MAGTRSTKIETELRIEQIQKWIINGVPEYLILRQASRDFKNKDGLPLSTKQIKRLVGRAFQSWQDAVHADIDQKRLMRIAELKQDLQKLKPEFLGTPKGLDVSLRYKREISKLEALYHLHKTYTKSVAVSVEHSIKNEDFSESEEKRLEYLLQKAQELKKGSNE